MAPKPHKRVTEMVRDMQAEEEEPPRPRINGRALLIAAALSAGGYVLLVAALVLLRG